MEDVDQYKRSGFFIKILKRLRMINWKVHDLLFSGIRIRHQSITLLRRSFDDIYYLENNPDVSFRQVAALKHFLLNGIYEQRKARFFDAQWYTKVHADLRLSPIDAYSHYKIYGELEGRSARYFEIKSVLERSIPPTYEEWYMAYDHVTNQNRARLDFKQNSIYEKKIDVFVELNNNFNYRSSELTLKSLNDQFANIFNIHIIYNNLNIDYHELTKKHNIPNDNIHLNSSINDLVNPHSASSKCKYLLLLNTPVIIHPLTGYRINKYLENGIFDVGYFDEDEINQEFKRENPKFKPDNNYEFLMSSGFLGPFLIFRKEAIINYGGFNLKYGEHTSFDLVLRLYENSISSIRHFPFIASHALKDYVLPVEVHETIVSDHLKRKGVKATVCLAPETPNGLRIRYPVPAHTPLVSIIIPTRDRLDILKTCITSVIEKTTYPNYEIIIVDNGSVEQQTLQYLSDIRSDTIHILRDDRPFNYSALNNAAARTAKGEYLCLMNNDIEIITPDWIEEMLGFAARTDTGCVGARLWYPDMTLQHGGVLVGFHNAAGHLHKHLPKGETGYMDRAVLQQNVGAVTAACLMVAKDTYWQVDGLDEDFVVAFNDVDFCLKVEALGLRNVWTPYAEMIHYESASRGANITPEKLARENREVNLLRTKWGDRLKHEPTYSPNLTFTAEDLSLAFPPRTETIIDYLGKTTAKGKGRISSQKR